MVSLGVSRVDKTDIIFIELGAKVNPCITVNVLLVKDCCLMSEPSVVSTDGLSSRMVHAAEYTLGLYGSRMDTLSP